MSGGGFYPRRPQLVTLADDPDRLWLRTGITTVDGRKLAQVERFVPDAMVRAGDGEWWFATDTDKVRLVPRRDVALLDGKPLFWPPAVAS